MAVSRAAGWAAVAATFGAGLLVGVAGCGFQRSTYPTIATSEGFSANPNTPAGEQVVVESLRYVASRWNPGSRMIDPAVTTRNDPAVAYPLVVNLPEGTRKMFYERIPPKIGPQALPATPETVAGNLPTFHVTRVWIRWNTATVDVLRPMPELSADGRTLPAEPVYQKVTLRLEGGGIQPWRVVHARSWDPGADVPPEYNFVPAVDNPGQWDIALRERAAREEAARSASATGNTVSDASESSQAGGTP